MADRLAVRVNRIIAGGVHALLDRIEDAAPEAMMEQSLREIREVTQEVRHELGIVSANKHLTQQQHTKLQERHAQLESRAREALGDARDDLARAALEQQMDIEAQEPVLKNALADLNRQEIELRGYVDALLAKQRELRDAIDAFLASRAQVAAVGAAGGWVAQGKVDDAMQAFDTLYRRQTGLSPGAMQTSLGQGAKLKELDDNLRYKQIEQRLARLKGEES